MEKNKESKSEQHVREHNLNFVEIYRGGVVSIERSDWRSDRKAASITSSVSTTVRFVCVHGKEFRTSEEGFEKNEFVKASYTKTILI